jgi:hypothetical protein
MTMSTSSLIQIPLGALEPLVPLPVDRRHYVAVLQSKTGERNALLNASESTWERLTPVVEVVGPKTPKVPLTGTSVAAWIMRLAGAVGRHPFYLDILRLDPMLAVATTCGEQPVLAKMYAEARKRRMRFVPVAHVGESRKEHVDLVADAILEDGHGVGLRYRMRRVIPPEGSGHRDLLRLQLSELGSRPEDADLLVDLEYLDEDDEVHPEDLAAALHEMSEVGEWRCLVVIGTSVPKMLSCVQEGTVGTIPRREWNLWSALTRCGLARVPAFGDYAVQHPEPPLDDIGGNTMRANIRYTTRNATLVARGRGPVSREGSEQYYELCEQLVARPEFAGASYSWGDAIIADCANGSREPGSQNLWRGAGTSHHLQLVTDRVRELHEESQSAG